MIYIGLSEVSKNPDVSHTSKITGHDFLSSSREAKQGDLILPIPENDGVPAYFLPSSVPSKVKGNIIASLRKSTAVAKWDLVVINKGNRDEIKVGSMFSIYQPGPGVLVTNNKIEYSLDAARFNKMKDPDLTIPPLRVGELMVYKVYEKMSIAIIMRSTEVMISNYNIEGLEF